MARDKKPPRIDTDSTRTPLTDNPFGALRADGLPTVEIVEKPEPETTRTMPEVPYRIRKTAKGGYHLSIQKRASGKVVTVIHNVEGDGDALARELKRRCGVGGTYVDGVVELQGDVREKVEALLTKWLG